MKVYYEAGLKNLAIASGHRAETLKSISAASNFKRTHNFLTQAWEAFFREFIRQFLLSLGFDSSPEFEAIMELVKYNLFECNKVCVENNSYDDYAESCNFE